MSIEVKIPSVGESISSGIIAAWHKKDGDQVLANEPLLTLETDKVSTEIVAAATGRVALQAKEGDEVKIGQVVATIEHQYRARGSSKFAIVQRPLQRACLALRAHDSHRYAKALRLLSKIRTAGQRPKRLPY